MKRIIINLLVVFMLINPYFVNTIHADNDGINEVSETNDEEGIQEESFNDDNQDDIDEDENIVVEDEPSHKEDLMDKQEPSCDNLNNPNVIENGENELELSQDSDGNLYITCEDSDFFDEIDEDTGLSIKYYGDIESSAQINSIWISNAESYNYNNSTFFETNQGFTVEEDGGSKYILISKESCLAENVGSGFIEISCNSRTSNRLEISNVAKKCNSSITIYEDTIESNGIEKNALIIESNDKDFLHALTIPSKRYTNNETGVYYNLEGSMIDFSNVGMAPICWSNADSTEDIKYDENGQFVYILEETIRGYHIKNENNISLSLYAYGYEKEIVDDVSITIGCIELENEVTIHQDSISGDLIIESEDKEFLQALVKERVYLPNSWIDIEHGSSFDIIDQNEEWHSSFHNQWCASSSNRYGEYEYYYDEQNEYVYVPLETLFERNISEGYIDEIIFDVYGYASFSLEFEPNEVQITKGCQQHPNDISVEEDIDGNIIISSEDLDFLNSLARVRDTSSNYSYGVLIEYIADNWTSFRNYLSSNIELVLDENEKTVTISHDSIVSRNVGNGTKNIKIRGYGYTQYETTVELNNACKGAPTGVTVEVNTKGELVINSADIEWIAALNSIVNYNNDSYISFYNRNTGGWVADVHSTMVYPLATISNNGKRATVTPELLIVEGVPNGTYTIKIHAYGYETLDLSTQPIVITKGAKEVDPSTISISYDLSKETIKISSTNKDFISKLVATSLDYRYSSSPEEYIQGGIISFNSTVDNINCSFSNYKQYFDNKLSYQYSDTKLSSDGKTVTISKDAIYNMGLARGYDYHVYLNAQGYKRVQIDVEDLQVGVNPVLPDDIEINYVEGKGLEINSNDSAWLNGISLNAGEHSVSIGIIYFSDGSAGYRSYDSIREDGKITVPIDLLYKSRITTRDDYGVRITSYGYKDFVSEQNIHIDGIKEVTSPVTFRQGDGLFIIESDDKEFLKALCGDPADLYFGSYIAFRNDLDGDKGLYNYGQNKTMFYDETNEYGYAYLDYVKEINNHFYDGCPDFHMFIEAFGYEDITMDYQLKLINCEENEVVAGTTEQLSFADFDEDDVEWFSSNESIATISEDGVLKGEKAGMVTITAKYTDGDGNETYDNIDIKITSNSKVALKLKTEDNNTLAKVGVDEQLVLTVSNYTLTENDVVTFTSSDSSIASVSNSSDTLGKITFHKPGNVTITANAVNKSVSLKLSVYNVDKSLKVALTCNEPFLEVDDEDYENLFVFKAGGEIVSNDVAIKYTSSNPSIVSVDENTGALTALKKGSVKITAAIDGDPSNRKATCTVQVVETIIHSIDIDELDVEDDGSIVNYDNQVIDGSRVILFDYADLEKTSKFHIDIEECGLDRDSSYVTPASVSYVSTDSSVASVDKNGYVSFKKAGQVTITVTVTSNPKGYETVSKDVIFKAIDYAPRIESNKLSINKYYSEYPSFNVYKILDTSIDDYKITETDGSSSALFKINYNDQDSTFKISFKNGIDAQNVSAKSYSQYICFKVNNRWYKYKVSVVITSNIPSVTPKVTGFYNTFTNENSLKLENTIKNGVIDNIEFVGGWADYDSITGEIFDYTATSGVVRYSFEEYESNVVVEKTIKLPEKSTKPTIKLDNSTFTLYVPDGTSENKTISFKLLDSNKNIITDGDVSITTQLNGSTFANGSMLYSLSNDGIISIKIPTIGLKAGKIVLSYQGDGWASTSNIPLTLNIKVSKSLPKAKLSATTISLNRKYHNTDSVNITIPGSSEMISNNTTIELVGGGSNGITASIDNGVITFITNNQYSTDNTYNYLVTPITESGLELATMNIKVTNSSAAPKATITVKNAINPLDENSFSPVTIKFAKLTDDITSIEFVDSTYKNLFEINEENNEWILNVIDGKDLSAIKDQTIKTDIRISSDNFVNSATITSTISFKLARKAPTVKLLTPTINVYDTTVEEDTLVGETVVDFAEGYEIDTANTIIPLALGYRVEYDSGNHKLQVYMIDGSKIKAGSTNSFNIKFVWKNDFINSGKFTKTTSIKLNVKDASNAIKSEY